MSPYRGIYISTWKKKKEQQIIFDGVVTEISSHTQGLKEPLLQNDGHLFVQKVMSYIEKVGKGGVIIDVGCGTGTLLNEINHHALNSYYMIGIDISSESVKMAKQKNEAADFIVCDIDALPLRDKASDIVIIRNVLHHLSTLKPLGNLVRLLNSNGFMLIDDKIRGNPFQEILVFMYPFMPHSFKMILKEKDNHIDRHGHLPPMKRYSPQAYMKFIKQYSNKLRIVEVGYHGFFLFLGVLEYLSYFFPRVLNIQIPFYKLYLLERRKILRWSAISMTIVVESV